VSGRNALLRAATYYTACVVVVDACDEPETVLARTFAVRGHDDAGPVVRRPR
jgi:hypothetical protein